MQVMYNRLVTVWITATQSPCTYMCVCCGNFILHTHKYCLIRCIIRYNNTTTTTTTTITTTTTLIPCLSPSHTPFISLPPSLPLSLTTALRLSLHSRLVSPPKRPQLPRNFPSGDGRGRCNTVTSHSILSKPSGGGTNLRYEALSGQQTLILDYFPFLSVRSL